MRHKKHYLPHAVAQNLFKETSYGLNINNLNDDGDGLYRMLNKCEICPSPGIYGLSYYVPVTINLVPYSFMNDEPVIWLVDKSFIDTTGKMMNVVEFIGDNISFYDESIENIKEYFTDSIFMDLCHSIFKNDLKYTNERCIDDSSMYNLVIPALIETGMEVDVDKFDDNLLFYNYFGHALELYYMIPCELVNDIYDRWIPFTLSDFNYINYLKKQYRIPNSDEKFHIDSVKRSFYEKSDYPLYDNDIRLWERYKDLHDNIFITLNIIHQNDK